MSSESFIGEKPDYRYLDALNRQQREAVEYIDGPSLVIAGAGSGKTRVLTYKIVHLLRCGIAPERILALTFTNKAAREMKERILPLAGEAAARRLWMGTFHSIFLRILRRHADLIGFQPGFTIYDSADSKSLVKMIVKELELDDKAYKPSAVASAISNAKNALIDPERYMNDAGQMEADRKARRPMLAQIYMLYNRRLKAAQAMDFDDILYYMNVLLRDFPDVARYYAEWFRYVLVDEYQDTNFAQHLIIMRLTELTRRLCVVGDDAQSIYSFRGASISNILGMEKAWPDLHVFKLERNYRSTQNIVDASGSLIRKNSMQMQKNVYSENERGEKISVFKTYSDLEEAATVASLISASKMSRHDSLDDYVVLYRTNAQSRTIEEALRKRNIPYRIFGGQSFYQRKEIKDAICYFRLSINPDDDEALRRIINYPARGIGETTMKKLQHAATESGKSLWSVICSPEMCDNMLNSGTRRKLADFAEMIRVFIRDAKESDAYEHGRLVYNRTGLLAALAHDRTPESVSRRENLEELLSGLKEFVDLRTEQGGDSVDIQSFLNEVSLATDMDESDDSGGPKVTLMTVHAAKGLEFRHVYVTGVERDLFPSAMAQSQSEIEEERRLLYVAITRAEQTCTLTFSGSRFRNGQTMLTGPSRFLADIDPAYLAMQTSLDLAGGMPSFVNPAANYYRTERSGGVPLNASRNESAATDHNSVLSNKRKTIRHEAPEQIESTADGLLRPGVKILHNRFGMGVVRQLEVIDNNEMIIADFGVSGIKKLIRKYAKFTIVK